MSDKTKKLNFLQEIDNKIFWPSALIILAICIPSVLYEQQLTASIDSFFNSIVINLNWAYVWYPIILIIFGIFIVCSKYGNIVLGNPADKPKFTLFQYSSILIAMAFGSTLMRTGVIQWADIALAPPFGVEALSHESMVLGSAYTMYIWGFPLSAIYAMTAPAIAYFLYVRKGTKVKISEILRVLFGDKFSDGMGGKIIDIIFIIAIVIGAATFIGYATPVLSAIICRLTGMQPSFTMDIILTVIIIAIFSASAYLGIEKGIKRLSELNMYIAAVLALVIIIAIPGGFIIGFLTDAIGSLFNNYFNFTFYSNALGSLSGVADPTQSFTVFWWAYCAGWSLLQSIFAAMISRGRTVREMILVYFIAPQFVAITGIGVLGGAGVWSYATGALPLFDILAESGQAVAVSEVLGVLPFSLLISIIFIFLFITFLSTTMDSTTYTVAAYANKTNAAEDEPSKSIRLIWAIIMSIMALVMMKIGGLAPLSVLNGVIGIPVIIIQFLTLGATIKMMNQDKAWINNVRKE